MTPRQPVRIIAGPYYPTCHDAPCQVEDHAPGTYIPIAVMLPGEVVVSADVLAGEIEAA